MVAYTVSQAAWKPLARSANRSSRRRRPTNVEMPELGAGRVRAGVRVLNTTPDILMIPRLSERFRQVLPATLPPAGAQSHLEVGTTAPALKGWWRRRRTETRHASSRCPICAPCSGRGWAHPRPRCRDVLRTDHYPLSSHRPTRHVPQVERAAGLSAEPLVFWPRRIIRPL